MANTSSSSMASSIFRFLKKYRNLPSDTFAITTRSFCSQSRSIRRRNLFSRISPLGHPSISLVPVLDQWVEEGMKVKDVELRRIVRDLRSRKRFKHALEVSEWMTSKGLCPFSPGDCAVQIDLIGKGRGVCSAESYFNSLSEQDKIEKTYGALLNCYVREGLIDKSLAHMQKMKELGFASNALSYNGIMCLYTRSDQLDKIPDVLLEMKKNGVSPDKFSYRVCINSYGVRSDLNSMEKVLEEMESQFHVSLDWTTYAMVANFYQKAGARNKSLVYLKKCEELVGKDALGYNYLISLYSNLGKKEQMTRLWNLQKAKCKKQINRDYITMLGLLVKLGELEECEKLLKEWHSSCEFYDFRVPNILLIGYCRKGLIEKAVEMLHGIVEKGKTPTPNSWAIIAAGYLDRQDLEMAFECMKEAVAVRTENKGWRPKPEVVSSVLAWLADNGDVEEVEAFVSSLKTVIPVNREMYHALIKAYTRVGRDVDWLLQSMKADDIDKDEETEKILSSARSKIDMR